MKAPYTNQLLLLAAAESVEEHIYFLEVSQIDNVLPVHLHEMEREMKGRKNTRMGRGRDGQIVLNFRKITCSLGHPIQLFQIQWVSLNCKEPSKNIDSTHVCVTVCNAF